MAEIVVGPVTVSPVNNDVPPTTPPKLTLPPAAAPVVTVRAYGPLIVRANRIGDDVVVIVVLPINETVPLNIAPTEFATPFKVKAPVNQTGVVLETVRDFSAVHLAPSMGRYVAALKLIDRSTEPPVT